MIWMHDLNRVSPRMLRADRPWRRLRFDLPPTNAARRAMARAILVSPRWLLAMAIVCVGMLNSVAVVASDGNSPTLRHRSDESQVGRQEPLKRQEGPNRRKLAAVSSVEFAQLLPKSTRMTMLRDYLRGETERAVARRRDTFESLDSADEIFAHQQQLKKVFVESLGGWPSRTPLNPQIVGRIEADGYIIERILFASRPSFLVTANLYLPRTRPPFPAVVMPCGHSEISKAEPSYQKVAIQLARHGIAAFIYDAIGQGERKQILQIDEAGRTLPKGQFAASGEHMVEGVAPILLGESLATYRIWDGIRSVDYLCSRPDVDSDRIGCTGNSGGGLMTGYLMAIDDRVLAAAPSCFITTTLRKNDTPGPGDAEQNVFGQIANGIDHPDYIVMRAPRPTLILAGTKDFIPIGGAWEAFRDSKRVFGSLGHPDRIDLIEADAPHGYTLALRNGAVRWMSRWLLDQDEPIDEPESLQTHEVDELLCTPKGQTLLIEGAKSVFDLYKARARELSSERKSRALRDAGSNSDQAALSERLRHDVRQTASIRPLAELPEPKASILDEVTVRGMRVERVVLRPEDAIALPSLVFHPDEETQLRRILYVDGSGKQAAVGVNGPVERYVAQGYCVMVIDIRGQGETRTTPWRFSEKYSGPNAAEFFIAYMLGRSLVGMQAEDLMVAARWLQSHGRMIPENRGPIKLVARGKASVAALHAAACQTELLSELDVEEDATGVWREIVDTPVTYDRLETVVHGALRVYDLDDLARLAREGRR